MTDRERFEVRHFPHDVIMVQEADHRENVSFYLVPGNRNVAVIDTGLGSGDLRGLVADLTSCRPVVVQTHLHWDHVGASFEFGDVRAHATELGLPRIGWPWQPPDEAGSRGDADEDVGGPKPGESASDAAWRRSGALRHGDRIDLGGRSLEVIHTPGHSPGSVSFLDRDARVLFTGDLCYLGQMLLFVAGSDLAAFRDSLRTLATVAVDVDAIYPAHGPAPLTRADVVETRNAFELVWNGRKPGWHGSYSGHRVAIHDFGRFAFLVPPE